MKGNEHGYILYSDMTRSKDLVSGKTPIGVVVCSYAGGGGQAMALKKLGYYEWGGYGIDIPTLPNLKKSVAYLDISSCENTSKIIAAGDKNTYPAAWAAHEYKTEGTNAGDWCLPAAGIMTSIQNKDTAMYNGSVLAGGEKIGILDSSNYLSSTEDSSYLVYTSGFGFDDGLFFDLKDDPHSHNVRPVIEF